MRVQCILCDAVYELDDTSLEAKRLRNKPLQTYMCPTCHERITAKTKRRRGHAPEHKRAPGQSH
ncbi:YlaI family protein [Novibacillus thermophilus]|uniref:DUF2197 domain-containing protein n=1 Tax=Novibacillus thermophilus TaxID=1471761 RepID=A0A1U9K648_9BACL|nr:hypothetical protein B0W44_06525 [Novibacillus thermophilus]